MKKIFTLILAGILTTTILSACGQDPEITAFKYALDNFCTRISEIDTSINNIDAQSEYATDELLRHLDSLDMEFQNFAELDFPDEFDYLEEIAEEASEYMTEAVKSYTEVYSENYSEATAEYAKENYSRAYKRIQIIITFLHGDKPADTEQKESGSTQ